MIDNEIITIDIEKYANALNNLIGVDSAYFKGDKDVDAIVEIIVMAKKMEGIINRQKTELNDLREIVYMDRTDAIKNLKAEVIKEFAERLKAVPIKCGLPLLGLSTKEEIEGYFNDIMMQVGNAVNNLVKEMTEEE